MTTPETNPDDLDSSQDDDLSMANLVMLWRVYDLLSVIALATAPNQARAVLEAHEQGRVVGSPPNLSEEPQ